ncbi:MAG TPA: cupredoxin domain-containing protein [Acidimicrobiales bacterium]
MRTTTTGRRALALAAVAGLALGAAACGDDDDDTSAGDGATTTAAANDPYGGGDSTTTDGDAGGGATLEVTGLQYTDVSASAGGSVEIVNSSGAPHTFTSDDDAFASVDVPADGTATAQAPAEPGEYPFHCEIHPSMQATLTVE